MGHLTGFPFPPGGAGVLSLSGPVLDTLAPGFTDLIDVAHGANGSACAPELDSDGLLGPGATGTLFGIGVDGVRTLLLGGLESPTGLALGTDSLIHAAENGFSPTDGRVLALAPAPMPRPASRSAHRRGPRRPGRAAPPQSGSIRLRDAASWPRLGPSLALAEPENGTSGSKLTAPPMIGAR